MALSLVPGLGQGADISISSLGCSFDVGLVNQIRIHSASQVNLILIYWGVLLNILEQLARKLPLIILHLTASGQS